MHLTAIFESWHVGDGNYHPFHVGQGVNLSFEVDSIKLRKADPGEQYRFDSAADATCSFVADVARYYGSAGDTPVAVLDAGFFRFYIHGESARSVPVGDRVKGTGILALDHYLWVEFLAEYPDPPDLFYNLEVRRIRRVRIPQRFIRRHAGGKTMPATVGPGDYSGEDIQELKTMEGQEFDEEFYIIDFASAGLENERLARSFL